METLLPLYHRFGDSLEYTYLICLYKVLARSAKRDLRIISALLQGLNALSGLEYILSFPNTVADQIFCVVVMVQAQRQSVNQTGFL